MTAVVFLHIPKTAGQTIHHALVAAVGGPDNVSPVRTHTQAPNAPQMPAGYKLYSGHIDWTELETLPQDRFVFSVLRDPRERIASFYLYLLNEAGMLTPEQLALPRNTGKRHILEYSADDYFFGGSQEWQTFILDHYNNFYCTYFATGKMRGSKLVLGISEDDFHRRAKQGLAQLDAVYSIDNLQLLETDIFNLLGAEVSVTKTYHNAGNHAPDEARWPKLLARMEQDKSGARLEEFARLDEVLMRDLGML